jgi:ATP-dependent DNA ligase
MGSLQTMDKYPIQKVLSYSKFKESKNNKVTSPYAIMVKEDGWYVYIDFFGGKTEGLKSSGDRVIPSLKYLSDKLAKIKPVYDCRLIFEATIPGLKFHETNGILNRKYEQAENVVLNLHDMIEFEFWKTPFINRYEKLNEQLFEDVLEGQFELIPILETTTKEDLFTEWFTQLTSIGNEGIILKNINSGYSFGKRNSDVMKIKEEITEDCIVLDILEGQGKYKDTTGTLVVARENGTIIQVSGMTDAQREDWWFNRDNILHKYVEIKAMKELPDGNLREPRFKAVRYDK